MHVVDLPPEPRDPAERERALAEMKERIRKAGMRPAPGVRRDPDGAHPGMHETDTIDYVIVLSGEVYAVMDKGEKLHKAGFLVRAQGAEACWKRVNKEIVQFRDIIETAHIKKM